MKIVMKTTIIIPTYNEAENIEPIIREILKYLPETTILIVDDDSPDNTGKIAERLSQNDPRIKFISRKGKPRSFAQSYIEGFKMAISNGADYIIQMDADFSHNPKYLPLMLEKLKDCDLVVGSRYKKGGKVENWPPLRKFISRCGNIYSKIITSIPINDLTSGFAAWKAEALKKIDLDKIHSNGYAFQIEMKFQAWKNGFRIKEIPIVFTDRKLGNSKMSKKIVLEAALFCLKLSIFNNPRIDSLQNEKIKDYYRHIENYDWIYVNDNLVGLETFFHRNRSKKIIKLINQNIIKNNKCLDIGCGTGLFTRHLPPGSIGLDINPRNLEKARKYAPHIHFIKGDIEKIDFPNDTFETIICTEVFEHLPDPTKAITEIKKVIKPNGILIGSVPTNGFIWKLRFLSRTCGTKEPYHKHYSKSEINKLLKSSFCDINIFSDIIRMNWFFVAKKPKK